MPAGDPYKILGIPNTATEEEVKTAYRELAKKYHLSLLSILTFLQQEKKKQSQGYSVI